MNPPPPISTLLPYPSPFRSKHSASLKAITARQLQALVRRRGRSLRLHLGVKSSLPLVSHSSPQASNPIGAGEILTSRVAGDDRPISQKRRAGIEVSSCEFGQGETAQIRLADGRHLRSTSMDPVCIDGDDARIERRRKGVESLVLYRLPTEVSLATNSSVAWAKV